MNRSTRNALRVSALAPAVVLLAMAGAPAQAGTADGPLAQAGLIRKLSFAGLMARCSTMADGVVHGIATITGGKVGDSPVPLSPVADYKLPLIDPGLGLTLNKQVKDPFGGMTVSAVSLESVPGGAGPVRDFAVTRCAAHGLRRGDPVISRFGLPGALFGAVFGGLPGLSRALSQPG
ncbi:MAG TPA: hypothetical protein VNW94_02365 [Streptosporangiaceae bacterium]|nr:hypothetical protein [Streptosporangiaceae bacterium]